MVVWGIKLVSVINQMLKDLEENKQNSEQVTPVASITPGRSSKLVMLLLMLLITGLAALAVYLFTEQLHRQDAELSSAAVSVAAPSVVAPQNSAIIPVATIPEMKESATPVISMEGSASANQVPKSAPDPQQPQAERSADDSSVHTEKMRVSIPATDTSATPVRVSEAKAAESKTLVSASSVPDKVVATVPTTKVTPIPVFVKEKPAASAPAVEIPATLSTAADNSFAIKPVQRSRKEQTARYFKLANDALLIGDTLQAKKQLVKILRLDKHHDQAREKLASLLYGEQRFGNAVKLLQQGLSVSPHYSNFRLMLARIYLQNNDKQQAYYYLKPLKPDVRDNLDYYAMLAGLAQSLGDLEQAKAAYLQLTKYDANRAKWWLGLGISADKLQQQALALSAYKQAQSMGQLSPASRRYINDRINQLEKY